MHNQLQQFYYQAWTPEGKKIAGRLAATHPLLAKQQLIAQGFLVKKLRRCFFSQTIKVSRQDLLRFTQQLSTLLQAHLPLSFCLKTLQSQFSAAFNHILNDMQHAIANGASLAQAMHQHAAVFPHDMIQLIKVGEASGELLDVLQQINTYQQQLLEQTQRIKKALFYPVFILSLSLFITLGLLIFIVPQFQLLFADIHSDLPKITQGVFYFSNVLQNISAVSLLTSLIALMAVIYSLRYRLKIHALIQACLYRLPLLGQLLHDNQQIKYCRSLSIALAARLPLTRALALAQQVIQTSPLACKTALISQQVSQGMPFSQSLQKTSQFAPLVIQLVQIGEQTGQLAPMLAHGAQVLEQHMAQLIHRLTVLLQPTLMLLLGLLLGVLMIALYLPIFNLGVLY